ncbi:MAG: hypothetical protein IJG31_06390 [Fusobacterium sp.]|nr:hypothetical protein [Fusobacterium sp.]
MKKTILFMMFILTTVTMSVEILNEFYVMEKVITFLDKEATYNFNGEKFKAKKVDSKLLKALATTDNPFYFLDSNNQKKMVRIGDYLISPLTLSEIYAIDEVNFRNNFIKE